MATNASTNIQAGARSPRRKVDNSTMRDRKSTRLNSSHGYISYAVFCLKKKNQNFHGLSRVEVVRSLFGRPVSRLCDHGPCARCSLFLPAPELTRVILSAFLRLSIDDA